ncbi:ParA family protein [Agrobacterium sp. 22094]|uniref:ParA family protein n=1 Tax=Agrobacterium sp. 22094 TaxID=3453872 RepID=UPI003F8409FC
MKVIAFFNNKGGVGKTTLIYHVGHMLADQGYRVVMADLDPQSNLTAMSLTVSDLVLIEDDQVNTIYDSVAPVIASGSDVFPVYIEVTENLALIPGDLELSNIEDALSREWTQCLSDSALDRERAFAVTTSLARTVKVSAEDYDADYVLLDVGPNLGAINRSALLLADFVIVPVAPDVFSLKGLSNVGKGLMEWRKGWLRRRENAPKGDWPVGEMDPLGYVVSRFSIYAGERAIHFRRWIDRVPRIFHGEVLRDSTNYSGTIDDDPAKLAWLKDYRSLMPMAMEANKPIFRLKPSDGAIGGHQSAVTGSYDDFHDLASSIVTKIGNEDLI